jgi:hypothetical protein
MCWLCGGLEKSLQSPAKGISGTIYHLPEGGSEEFAGPPLTFMHEEMRGSRRRYHPTAISLWHEERFYGSFRISVCGPEGRSATGTSTGFFLAGMVTSARAWIVLSPTVMQRRQVRPPS